MQRHWNDHELETYWSFSSDEFTLIPQRDASSRLGVAASLKFFQLEGYFPSSGRDIPSAALDYYRGSKYVEETIKMLLEKPEPVLLRQILNKVAG